MAFEWRMNDLDQIGSVAVFTRDDISVGPHNISLRVKNDDDLWSDWVTEVLVIQASVPTPDGTVHSISVDAEDLTDGDRTTITITIQNLGNATGTFDVDIYLHRDSDVIDWGSEIEIIASYSVVVGAGGSVAEVVNWTSHTGDHMIVVWVDPDDNVSELRENNNIVGEAVQVSEGDDGGEDKSDELDPAAVAGMFLLIFVILVAIFVLMRRPRDRAPFGTDPDGENPPEYGMSNGDGRPGARSVEDPLYEESGMEGENPMYEEEDAMAGGAPGEGAGGSISHLHSEGVVHRDIAARSAEGSGEGVSQNGSKPQDYNSSRSNKEGSTAPDLDGDIEKGDANGDHRLNRGRFTR